MKTIILTLLIIAFMPVGSIFSQDDIYGDYLLFSTPKTVSLDLEDAKLVDVLKMFSQQTGLNFISTEAVRDRKLTLYLENVPLKEAMDIVFTANGLTYDYYPESSVFVVKEMGKPKVEIRTKVYTLKHACVSKSRMATGFTAQVQSGGDEEGGITGYEGVETNVIKVVEKVLTEHGTVTEEPRTNSLIISDVPSQFPAIDKVIDELDKPVKKIVIEVEVLDILKESLDELGMMVKKEEITDKGGRFRFMENANAPLSDFFNIMPNINDGIAFGTLDLRDVDIMMSFLKTKQTTRVMARPKLLVLSNQEAIIHVGDEIWSIETERFDDGGSTTELGDRKTQTGVQLKIIPQVDDLTNEVTLTLGVEISDDFNVDTGASFYEKPSTSVTTMTRLNPNETLLVGGLLRNDTGKGEEKIPFLGDIPLLGNLFKSRVSADDKREVLIFIRPHVIQDPSIITRVPRPIDREQKDYSKRKSVSSVLDRFSKN
ncbi:MAG: hypothetical protein GF375_06990 [Candidatus Omnitrophica bacterium]|nr:hypothetical protein [Candidatus Omnitrophota bacterium]MBD3269722.1 hypothetical protein [Candidatus Omnitrophota bacterium]